MALNFGRRYRIQKVRFGIPSALIVKKKKISLNSDIIV
jgi:hypothetical protein